jgi:glycosyltransferase involved in cell wall biosynthesis
MSDQSDISPDRPLVSVIVPVYNGERFLHAALQSIFEQDYYPLEAIVVNDGSTDTTAAIIKSFPNVTHVGQEHHGAAAARNKGIGVSRGEIITFLDSDDFWPRDRLTFTVRHLRQRPETGYVLGKEMMFVEPGCAVPSWVKVKWLVEPQDASNTGVLVVRRETFERIGTFNEDYRAGEDTEWLVRASEAGIPMAQLQQVVLYRRIHGDNLSSRMLHVRKANLMRIARESINRQQAKKSMVERKGRRSAFS